MFSCMHKNSQVYKHVLLLQIVKSKVVCFPKANNSVFFSHWPKTTLGMNTSYNFPNIAYLIPLGQNHLNLEISVYSYIHLLLYVV